MNKIATLFHPKIYGGTMLLTLNSSYFSEKEIITEKDLVIGSNFTYGWMPTIMNFKSNDFQLAVTILNNAKGAERISSENILLLEFRA